MDLIKLIVASSKAREQGGIMVRLAALPLAGSAKRDRAQTNRHPRCASAGREGKAAGWPPPAV